MIENAELIINGKLIQTRLHEHGKQAAYNFQPSRDWLYSGYFDGKPEDMQAIKNASPENLAIMHGEEVVQVIQRVKWGDVVETYERHAILHLDWEGQDNNYE